MTQVTPSSPDAVAPTAMNPPQSLPPPPGGPPPEAVEAIRKINEQRPGAGIGIQMALGMPSNPIQQKVNESHITKALEIASTSQNHDFVNGLVDRGIQLVALAVIVGVGVFLIEKFQDRPTILVPTLTGFGGFIAGGLSGLGVGRVLSRKGGS